MKKQNGITLIALIITIIVMLILVGVTINVALNGGLIEKAKTAGEQTQRETDKEQLLSAVIGTLNNDGTVNEAELQEHLPDIFKYENGVYKNKITGKEYTVDSQTGKVTEATSTNSGSTENQENSGNTGNTEQSEGTYVITAEDIATIGNNAGGFIVVEDYTQLINISNSENLKSIMTLSTNMEGYWYYFNNITCSDETLNNISTQNFENISNDQDNYYFIYYNEFEENGKIISGIMFGIKKNGTLLTDSNYTSDLFKDLTFTITK